MRLDRAGVEQPIGDGLEQCGGVCIDRVVRGDPVFLVQLLSLLEGDALLLDVVLVDHSFGVGVLPVVRGNRPSDVVADRRDLCRVIEYVLAHDQALNTGVDAGSVA